MADEEIAGLAVKLAMDDSSFTTGIQSLKRELNVLDSGFKVTESSSATFGKSLDGLKEKASSLGEKIQVQQKIVQQYQEQLAKSKTVLEENSKTMMELKEKVNTAKAAWQESAVAEGENAEATKKLEAEYKSLEKQYESQEQLVARNSKSVDGYTINMNKQQASLNKMQNDLQNTSKQIELQSSKWVNAGTQLTTLSKKTKDVGEGFTTAGESMSTKVTLPVVAGLTAMTVSASTFEHQMADISKEVASKGEDVNSVMGQMSSSSLKWSEDFGQSTTSINEGLLTLVKDGYTGSEAMNIMGTSLDTARGADEDLTTVVDQLGSSLEAYGMKTNDAATTTANMSHMADTFAYVANHTKASISGLGEAFSIVGPLASQLKIPMSQTAAAIGELESNGIDASTAATALQAGLVNLTKPTAKMQAALKEMNFSAFDNTGKMKDLTTIIAEMSQKTAGWTDKQREAAYATIFGKESLATWGILMHKGSDYLGNLSTNANNATGEVKKLSDSMKNTPQNNLKELEGSMKALGVAIGEDVVPTLIPLAKDATEAVKSFASLDDGTKKMIITVAGVAAVVGPTLVVIGKVATGISAIEGVLGKVSGAIGKKVVANATDTASTAANTVATSINTAAQEANTKARETNATSEGISTVAKDTSTAAEAENTAATVANEAAQGKNAVSAVNTAEKMTKLSGEAGTAGKALLGAGTAAGTAGEAIAGAGTAAGEAGGAMSGAGAAAGGTAAAGLGVFAAAASGVALAGYGIYKAYKYVTDETVPQVDLFADSVVETATKVKAQNGTVATQMKDTTVSISNSTKQAISSYMDMDKKVSKSMQDIYVNANNFSKQEKSTVISAYTDMANKVTSLTGSNKTATINNFKEMVSNTNTLTAQNRSQIVAQYSQMVSQVSGLTAQQKQKTIKDFSDSLAQASGITQSQATGIINQFKQMGSKINSAIDQTDQSQIKKVQDLFSKTTTISNQEQADILQSMQKHDTSKKAEANIYEQQITDIMTKAINNHGQVTQQDWQTMNDIKQRMQTLAVQTMSKSEVEQKVIMQRLKDYNGQMTLAQASDTIQNAEKQRKGAVDAANKEYNDKLATIIQMRDGSHKITAQQADDMIKEAKRQRDQSVKEADGQKQEIVSKVQQMNSGVEGELNTSTGKQLDTFQKFERGVSNIFSSIGSAWDSVWAKIGGTHTIDINTVMSGATGSASSAAGVLSNLHGLRLNATGGVFTRATRVTLAGNPNNVVGEAGDEAVIPLKNDVLEGIGKGIVEATAQLKNNKLTVEFADNSSQATQFGQKTMESMAAGMKSRTKLLASNTGLKDAVVGYADVLNKSFSDQLNTNVNVVDNKVLAVSDALVQAVTPERNFRAQLWADMAKGTENYDSALNKLKATNDKLAVSTGNNETDLRNILGEMTNLSTMAVVADNQYLKLGNSIGWSDDKTKDALKEYQDDQKSYLELGQKAIQMQQEIRDSQYSEAYETLNTKVKQLTADTGDYEQNLLNEQQAYDVLIEKDATLESQYDELFNKYGEFNDKVKDAKKSIEDNSQALQEMNNTIDNTKQKLAEAAESDWNNLFDKLKTSLKDYYDDVEKQDEASWQAKLDNNSKWKEDSLNALETVYTAKKSEIEREKTLLERSNSDQDAQDKIDEDNRILSMNYSAKKKAEAEKDKNDTIKEMNRRHQSEQLDDQADALEKQYNSDKDNIEAIAKNNEDYYNSQINSIKAFYEGKEKEANLDAEAQKLIVSNNQNEIVNLLKSYGQNYELAGASLGEQLTNGFKSTFSVEEIFESASLQMQDILNKLNGTTLSVPTAAISAAATNYNSNSTSYSTSYSNTYDSLFHADNITLNNAKDMQNFMEEIQRIADIQRMSKGVK